jgi:hypothetical protein
VTLFWCCDFDLQVELLLAAGAKGTAKNSNGKNPLDLAT